ncbi:MAG: AmmeMemoRadiSam system protein B [Thermoguttaceae bacterium]
MQEPYLSESQQIELFHAVGRRIASIVTQTKGAKISDQVPEIAHVPILGAFVSLKKRGDLRSCMGTMSDAIPLGNAMEQAANLAALEDPRFPPITAAELFELDLEIWILWGMRRVPLRGRDRINAITIGQHGIQIAKGGNRGLLLPGVALDFNMSQVDFLEAVCRKAGLPCDTWLDDASLLHTFEGRSIRGPFSATKIEDKKTADEMIFAAKFNRTGPQVPGPTPTETKEIRDACMKIFLGMVEGVAPSNYVIGLFDGNVSGISLSLKIPTRSPIICSQISVRPDVSLQKSMVALLQALAETVRDFGMTWHEVHRAEMEMAVYWDPVIHGNAKSSDLSAFEPYYRSLMISSPKGWTLDFVQNKSTSDILNDSLNIMQLDDLDLGEIISFETSATTNEWHLASIVHEKIGEKDRAAAIAGSFYPATSEEVDSDLDELFRDIPVTESKNKISAAAVMIPHAGWQYSGQLAAQTLSRVQIPQSVILFGPKHRTTGVDWAVSPHRFWNLPGRQVAIDLELSAALVESVLLFEFDEEAHTSEHSLEVQLPILHRLSPNTKMAAVVMGPSPWNMIAQGASHLAALLKQMPNPPLFIVSSDMNHFSSAETTRKLDRVALDAILSLSPEQIYETIRSRQISMCGLVPLVFAMETLLQLGKLGPIEEVGYMTSADVTGDTSRVVGYAGLIFRKS